MASSAVFLPVPPRLGWLFAALAAALGATWVAAPRLAVPLSS